MLQQMDTLSQACTYEHRLFTNTEGMAGAGGWMSTTGDGWQHIATFALGYIKTLVGIGWAIFGSTKKTAPSPCRASITPVFKGYFQLGWVGHAW